MATETSAAEASAGLAWEKSPARAAPPVRRRWLPKWLKWTVTLGLVVVIASSLVLKSGLLSPAASDRERQTHKVVREDVVVTVTASGNVESARNLDIKCEVAGGSTILWIIKDGTQAKEGDELVRLDSSTIEDQCNQQKIVFEKARAAQIEAEKVFSAAKIAVQEFEEGTYIQQMQDAEAKITIALENLRSAENTYLHTQKMARKGYVTSLQREAQAFAVEHSKLDLASARTAKRVLETFTKAKTMEDLVSKRDTAEAKARAEEASFTLEEARLKRLQVQLEKSTIRAPSDGMVVYANEPGGRPGQQGVQIEEGAAVRERQSIIRLPDLARMQVKVLVNESKVDLLRLAMRARIRIQDREFQGTVISVANQAEPATFFSSAVKDYATIVRIDGETSGLRPGMTAVVEILVANLKDVLSVPVQAVVEQDDKFYCWVENGSHPERRLVVLGVTNDTVVEIKDGLKEQDVVLLNPRALVAEAREEVRAPEKVDVKKKFGEATAMPESTGSGGPNAAQRPSKEGSGGGRRGGFDLMQFDKDGDKKISMDEAPDRMRANFDTLDENHDGFLDVKEIAALKRRMQQQGGPGGPPAP